MQLFVGNQIDEHSIQLNDEEKHHAFKVLRKQAGNSLFVTNGNGKLWSALIDVKSMKTGVLAIQELLEDQPKPKGNIHLAFVPVKNMDRNEWLVEKATELGVNTMSLFYSSNSERRKIRLDKLDKRMIGACKQCKRLHFPSIESFDKMKDFIESSEKNTDKFIAHLNANKLPHLLEQSLEKNEVIMMIGPEGDFTQEEVNFALENGYKEVSLGDLILRTETAAISTVHLLKLKVNFDL